MKKYRIMYIMNASLDDAARTRLINSFRKIITDYEDTISRIDEWGTKEFAYKINRMKKGYHVAVNATTNSEGIYEFERLAHINHNIVHYVIIRTQDEE